MFFSCLDTDRQVVEGLGRRRRAAPGLRRERRRPRRRGLPAVGGVGHGPGHGTPARLPHPPALMIATPTPASRSAVPCCSRHLIGRLVLRAQGYSSPQEAAEMTQHGSERRPEQGMGGAEGPVPPTGGPATRLLSRGSHHFALLSSDVERTIATSTRTCSSSRSPSCSRTGTTGGSTHLLRRRQRELPGPTSTSPASTSARTARCSGDSTTSPSR